MIPILIIGKSGAGKSASLRNLPTQGTVVVNVLGKPLPFRSDLLTINCNDYPSIQTIVRAGRTKAGEYERLVIDDFGYLMTDQFMRALGAKGTGQDMYALYSQIGLSIWEFVKTIQQHPSSARVYMMMHEETDDYGNVKPRTLGKLVEQKICLEGMVTICLRAAVDNRGKHIFMTNSNGLDVTKTPMGMFENMDIDNDLAVVDQTIVDYYNINKEENNNAEA